MSAPFPRLAAINYKTRADLMQRPAWKDLRTDSAGNPSVWLNEYRCVCGTVWTDEWSCCCDDDCPNCGSTNGAEDGPIWLGPIDATEMTLWCNLPEKS